MRARGLTSSIASIDTVLLRKTIPFAVNRSGRRSARRRFANLVPSGEARLLIDHPARISCAQATLAWYSIIRPKWLALRRRSPMGESRRVPAERGVGQGSRAGPERQATLA